MHTMQSFYHQRSVLVTGGAGFIGSHLCSALLNLGAQVRVLDDFSTGTAENLPLHSKLTIIEGSITDAEICRQATKNVSIVFHCAAFISVPDSMQNPARCHEVNTQGTAYLLEACRKHKVEHFVFSSSSAVYGPQNQICSENTACEPTSPYGYSKLMGELACQQYSTIFGLSTVCLRYFNVYGERQNPNGPYAAVVAKFKHNLAHNLPLTIFGDGSQTRDFIAVHDVVTANLRLGKERNSLATVYNIASGKSITLLELIDTLKKDFPDTTSSIIFAPARAGDIHHSAADCSKYKGLASP